MGERDDREGAPLPLPPLTGSYTLAQAARVISLVLGRRYPVTTLRSHAGRGTLVCIRTDPMGARYVTAEELERFVRTLRPRGRPKVSG